MQEFEVRAKAVRRRILTAIYNGKKGHIGGALSCADILLYLYGCNVVEPHRATSSASRWSPRPLILSKGHSATALLAVLDEIGFTSDMLGSYNAEGSIVGNNPCERVPGIEFHTGSLGHGVGLACGVALAHRLQGSKEPVTVLISDGELMEGSTWEALLFMVQQKLNVCVIVDQNRQICETHIQIGNIKDALSNLGLSVCATSGHEQYGLVVTAAAITQHQLPRIVIADTVKGKGVSFMEGVVRWHHSIPTPEEYAAAMEELK